MRIRFTLLTVTLMGLLLTHALAADSAADKTRQLINVLQTNSSFYEKARACQQLGEVGNAEAVPALAALLKDVHLNAYARSGLEGIPDPAAAEALRLAVVTLKGNQLAGVINSLGVLRDVKAVGLLQKLADDPASGVNREALLALGCIANDEALQTLRQFLVREPQLSQTNAASACLLAAEKQLTAGHQDVAVALYDSVRQANLPLTYRAAATRGAIVARKDAGVPLLIEQLGSKEIILRNAALYSIREIPSDALATALNTDLKQASAEMQIQLLIALTDCHNAGSLQVLQVLCSSENAEVRKVALTVLGQIGGATEVGTLLQALVDNRNAEEVSIARYSLGRMPGVEIDTQINAALASTTNADMRIKLFRLVEIRNMTNAVPQLFQLAGQSDSKVSAAALRALKSLATADQIPILVTMIRTNQDSTVREVAEAALSSTCTRLGMTDAGGELALTELKQATGPAFKISWIRVLVSMGYTRALPILLTTVNDPDNEVAITAIDQLAHWPDPTPVDDLLGLVQNGQNTALRKHALAAAIQLTTVAAEEHQRPEETLTRWKQRTSQLAGTIDESKGTSLFDGQTLAGWEGNTNVWRVQDGVIVGGSLQGNPRNEFLATVHSYTNFILRLEYKLVGTEGFVNGGVQFRSVRVKQPDNEMSGFQADIGAGYSGSLYDESRRNKFLLQATDEQIKRLEKPGDWNRYEVRCSGPHIEIMLNGEKTVDYTETDATLPMDGLIGLQIHGNCKAEISFRNLKIEVLP